MKKSFILITLSGTLLLSFQVYGQNQGENRMNMSMARHHFVMRNGIDPGYASKVNPLENTARNITVGKMLYDKNCALCHGKKGLGDGEAGKNLNPPAANIAMFIKMHNVPDGYLYWTIAEGGIPLKTAMPPFKAVLKKDEIWKTIIYLRKL